MAGFGGAVKLTGESEYRKALQQITQNLKEVSSQMKVVTSSYDSNDKSVAALSAKSEVLNKTLEQQKSKLNALKSQYSTMSSAQQTQITKHNQLVSSYENEKAKLDSIGKTLGTTSNEYKNQSKVVSALQQDVTKSTSAIDSNEKSLSNLRVQMNNAQADINKTSKEIDNLGKEAEESGKQAKNAGDGFTVFKGVLADLASKAIQSAISGIKKLGSAVVSVGKQAISSYASYEQLVGGVETLFKDSAKIVEEYANNAYKTAGMSANEYMETVTSFSASLLQSLGKDTKKAAEYGDLAITDMSDNANKMGTSMEMIQNAYQGFAKQNYTMLDNLKLGYGGTKTEMERLIKDANKVKKANGEMATLSINSFADVVEAIHIMQTEMGITGTTAKEASSTIEGSTKSMKAAWQNLLTGVADNTQDMDKLVNNFVDSAITASNNLVPRIKIAIDGMKKLIGSIVTDVFPKLKREIPELRPLIETFEWFIDHKSLVVNSVKLMVAAFAIAKINQFTKSMSDVVKSFLNVVTNTTAATVATTANTAATTTNTTAQVANTAAQTAGATATKGLAAAQNLLNAAWKANPIGLLVAGVTAAISVFSLFKSKTDEVTEAEKKQQEQLEKTKEAVKNTTESWNDLKESQQEQINTGMSELSYYQNLYDELTNLVDANGKVQEGYEGRASFIISTLNEALGTEITMTDGVIKKYGELGKSIEEVMAKKKAQIILDAQESLYSEAINNRISATKRLNELEEQLTKQKEKRKPLEDELNKIQTEYNTLMEKSPALANAYILGQESKIIAINNGIEALDKETADIQKNYDEQLNTVQEYAYNIGQYETNMALFHEGKYDEMTNVNWEYVKEYENAEDAKLKMLQDGVKEEEEWLEILQGMRNDSNKEQIDSQIETSKTKIKNLQEEMKQYQNTTESGLNETENIWGKSLSNQLSKITGKKVEFKKGADGNIQAYVDGIEAGEPTSEKEMKTLVENTIKEINKQKGDADTAGQNLIDGVNNGVKNQNKQNGVFASIANFGSNLLSKLKNSLKEKSPSKATKEMGQFLLEGLGLGIEDEEDNVLKQVSNVGKNVLSSLQNELSRNVKLGKIDASIPNIRTNSSANTYDNMVGAFKEALSEMKIELDDEVAGKFVENTVTRAIYS